jgi:hypothetical protein
MKARRLGQFNFAPLFGSMQGEDCLGLGGKGFGFNGGSGP